MIDPVEQVAEVLRVHRPQGWHVTVSAPMCCCGDSGEYMAHVARLIIDALQLTREAYIDGSEVFDPDEWPERRPLEAQRLVGPWVEGSKSKHRLQHDDWARVEGSDRD